MAKTYEINDEMPSISGICRRRKLVFKEYNESSKCNISKDLRKTFCFPELTHATNIILQIAGKTDAAELFIGALETSPMRDLGKCGLFMLNMLYNIYCWRNTVFVY